MLISRKSIEQVKACNEPQNLILYGERGNGKRLIGEALAASWLNCEREGLRSHPDFILIEPDGGSVKKGQIDEAAEMFPLRSSVAAKRIVLIDDASSMNAQAMNSLLKPLEDYGEWLAFILIAHAPLINTVKSRCRLIRIENPEEDELRDYIGAELDPICLCAAGSKIGNYMSLKGSPIVKELSSFLTVLNTMKKKGEILDVLGALKEKDPGYFPDRFKDSLDAFFNLIRVLFFCHLVALEQSDPAKEHPLVIGGAFVSAFTAEDTVQVLEEVSRCNVLMERKKFSKNDFFRLVAVMAGRRTYDW